MLRPLIEARLVTAGEDSVEISHEALLDGWPRLAGWLVEAREEILLRQRRGPGRGGMGGGGGGPGRAVPGRPPGGRPGLGGGRERI